MKTPGQMTGLAPWLGAAVMLAGMALAGAALADPAAGIWKTRPDDNGNYGHVKVSACGDRLCGVLVEAFDQSGTARQSDTIGKQIVWDMRPLGEGAYGEGQVWAPDRDKTYQAEMHLSGNTLSVSGCVMGGLICRAQEWQRVK